MIKFKGKFQEACCVNRGRIYKENWSQHCDCNVCEKHRLEFNIVKCEGRGVPLDQRCIPCQKLAIKIKKP